MFRIVRRDASQFREQLRGDDLRFGMLHAVHDAMTDGPDRGKRRLGLEPAEQKGHGCVMVAASETRSSPIFLRIADA